MVRHDFTLNLVAAHPDHVAGLKFVGYSVRACDPDRAGDGRRDRGDVGEPVVQGGAPLSAFGAPALILLEPRGASLSPVRC